MRYVFYVNVGDLPPKRADELVNEIKEKVLKEEFFTKGDKVLYVPIRYSDSRIEILGE